MPTLEAREDGDGWRLELPGGTSAWLPTLEACRVAARQMYAAVRPITKETEAERRAAHGDR